MEDENGVVEAAGELTIRTASLGAATAAMSTGSTTPSVSVNFVLTPPIAYVTSGTASLTGNADRPSIEFTLSNAAETLYGYGRAQ